MNQCVNYVFYVKTYSLEELLRYFLLIGGGFIAGIINVVAGAGSLLTLPVLIGSGLSPVTANGTNRINIILQDISATWGFIRRKELPLKITIALAVPVVLGAALGAYLATKLHSDSMNLIIMFLLVFMIIYVTRKPHGSSGEKTLTPVKKRIDWLTWILFLAVGIYGGFLQVATTIILMNLLQRRLGMSVITSDSVKIFLNLLMIPVAVIIFLLHGQISFLDGIIMGVGGFSGGWIGVKIANKLSADFVRVVMIVVLSLATIYMLLKILHLL